MASRILFVDDDSKLTEILALYLQEKGFEVTTAATLGEGKQLVEEREFDLAIVDVNLAGESGLDLVHRIKSKPGSMPVIVYTGIDVDEYLVQKTLHGQANGMVHKSESLGALLAMIRKHLANRAPGS